MIASCSGTNGFSAAFGRSSFGGESLAEFVTTFRRSSFGGELVTGFETTFGWSSVCGAVVTDQSSSVSTSAGRPSRAGPTVFVCETAGPESNRPYHRGASQTLFQHRSLPTGMPGGPATSVGGRRLPFQGPG